MTRVPGAYGLLIDLPVSFHGTVGALGRIDLRAGSYLYLGSANGSGGLRARISRHCRADKKPHWHIDHLTAKGDIRKIFAIPGGSECDLTQTIFGIGGVSAPIPGFGSSDCQSCLSHLLQISEASRDSVVNTLRKLCAPEMEVGDD